MSELDQEKSTDYNFSPKVTGLGLMDLFFASLDKNRDNFLSVNEVQQLNWCVVYPHHFSDFVSKIWKSAESNKGLSLSGKYTGAF